MKYLLDTHTLIWALEGNPKLPQQICEIICNENNIIYVSVASIWEITLKEKKKANFPYKAEEIVKYCQSAGYIFLSIGVESVINTNSLIVKADEYVNCDPFDNLLVSQCKINNMILITHDSVMKHYNEGCLLIY